MYFDYNLINCNTGSMVLFYCCRVTPNYKSEPSNQCIHACISSVYYYIHCVSLSESGDSNEMSNLFLISVNLIQAFGTHLHDHFAECRDRRDNKNVLPLRLVQGTKRHMCKISPASYLHSTLNVSERRRTLWLL